MHKHFLIPVLALLLVLASCNPPAPSGLASTPVIPFDTLVISDSANLWFARATAEFNGDGLQDVVLIDNNGFGGALQVLMGSKVPAWEIRTVAETGPEGGLFSCGDILAGDINGNGKPDILGPVNNGEWTELPKDRHAFYIYSRSEDNSATVASYLGTAPGYIKDVETADFDHNGLPDLACMSFDGEFVCVFSQGEGGSWEMNLLRELKGLHEGMALGDVNGDGYTDIAATGYCLLNPGDRDADWEVSEIDEIWHNQTGDWSRNATKHACADMDGDGKDEVLISHSERSGYPVALYHAPETPGGNWQKEILLDTLSSAHTLQVADFDLDGDPDVLTGTNKGRAWNLGLRSFPVYILLNQGDGSWEKQLIDTRGIYNGQIADFEGDGDVDIYRLESHDGGRYELLLNQAVPQIPGDFRSDSL